MSHRGDPGGPSNWLLNIIVLLGGFLLAMFVLGMVLGGVFTW